MKKKQELRKEQRIKNQRFRAKLRERETALLINQLKIHPWLQFHHILAYRALNEEPNLDPLLKELVDQGKSLSFPKVCGDSLKFFTIQSWEEDWEESPWGILEPSDSLPSFDLEILGNALIPVLVLVPALGFSPTGYRLGRGKGYYDRFLSPFPGIKSLGVAFSFQLLEGWEPDPWDKPLSQIISPALDHRQGPG